MQKPDSIQIFIYSTIFLFLFCIVYWIKSPNALEERAGRSLNGFEQWMIRSCQKDVQVMTKYEFGAIKIFYRDTKKRSGKIHLEIVNGLEKGVTCQYYNGKREKIRMD